MSANITMMPTTNSFQKTLSRDVVIEGIGVHSGKPVRMHIHPALDNTGVVFCRTDLPSEGQNLHATWQNVTDTRMATQLGDRHVMMVEHFMAALAALEINNARVEIASAELPVLDGSAAGYMNAMQQVGVQNQTQKRHFIKILKPIEVREGDRFARLEPCDTFTLSFTFDFFGGREGLKPQALTFTWNTNDFCDQIAPARTFGFYDDGVKLHAMGLALGSSLDNTIVIQNGAIMNPEGLRFPDECVRHKILDAVGDLYLAGAPFGAALYTSHNGGHELNNKLLRALFADKSAWAFVTEEEGATAKSTISPWQPFSADALAFTGTAF